MYSVNDWRFYSELYHHGIKGQRWGVKNGPPYPLDSQTHNAVTFGNARMYKKNMDDIGEYTKFTKPMQNTYMKNHPAESLAEFERLKPQDKRGKRLADIRRGINHPKDRNDAGRHYNCPNCATAFEMVERGYNVMARPKANGSNVENIESFFKDGKLKNFGVENYGKTVFDKWDEYKSLKDRNSSEGDRLINEIDGLEHRYQEQARDNVVREIKSQGDGARGILVVGWRTHYNPNKEGRTTAFHAINYKNEKGNVVFYDAQSYKQSTGDKDTEWIAYDCDPRELYVMRTDNLEISDTVGEAVISKRKA